jgi:hypothetical protein
MLKEINPPKSSRVNSPDRRKKTGQAAISAKDESEKQSINPNIDDSAEMFRGLITGDEHYHTRGTAFVPFWG